KIAQGMSCGLKPANNGRCGFVLGISSESVCKLQRQGVRGEGLTFDRDMRGYGVEMVDLSRTDRV
ncbi:unnamed protein product, partial [Dovyalis caffra]